MIVIYKFEATKIKAGIIWCVWNPFLLSSIRLKNKEKGICFSWNSKHFYESILGMI